MDSPTEPQSATFHIEDGWILTPDRFSNQPGMPIDPEEFRREVESLRRLYDSGTPMYPRDAIRDAARQLEAKCEQISIQQWNGGLFERNCRRDDRRPDSKPEVLQLWFHSFEALMERLYSGYPLSTIHPLGLCSNWHAAATHSLAEVTASFEEYDALWRKGEQCQWIRDHLLDKLQSVPSKVLGFALGTPDGRLQYKKERRPEPFCQHAAVIMIAKELEEKHGKSVPLYCQDPVYSTVDVQLLQKKGATVLDNPMGFLEIDRSSIVITVGPNPPMKQIVADDRRYWPMALICGRAESIEEEKESYPGPGQPGITDPTGNRFRAMAHDYVVQPLPKDDDFTICKMELYIRKDCIRSTPLRERP